jgi:serine/threonine-protein kinase
MQVDRASDTLDEYEPSGLPVEVGDVLDGKYRILRVIGKGGMGVVMAAVHTELGHRVALKFLLKSAVRSEEVVTRFAREARAAAMIQSEHATRVLDVGRLDTGEPFMVLEMLEGCDLGDMLNRSGPLPIQDAVTYVLEACEAIAEAHSLGIVHRDLKPDNLFLARRPDGSRTVKVLDFGISKFPLEIDMPTGKGSPLTTTSAVIGSPMYMSPEQLRATRDVDPRSDIWSIGVTLYELIAGQGPFPWQSLPELCAAILKDEPMPLSARRADVPPEFDNVLLRCLEKDPALRWQDVAELAAALSPFGRPSATVSSERAMRLLARTSLPPSHRETAWGLSPLAMTGPKMRAVRPLRTSAATIPVSVSTVPVPLPSTPPVSTTSTLTCEPAAHLPLIARLPRGATPVILAAAMLFAAGAGMRLRRAADDSFAMVRTAQAGTGLKYTVETLTERMATSVVKVAPPVQEEAASSLPVDLAPAQAAPTFKATPVPWRHNATAQKAAPVAGIPAPPPRRPKRPNPYSYRE